MTATTTKPPAPGRRSTGRYRREHGLPVSPALAVLCAVSAVLAAFSGAHPVGVGWLDAVWSGAFAVAVVLAASRSRRFPTIWLAGVAGVVGVGGGGAGLVFGVASLVGAVVTAFTTQRERLLGALVGVVATQALLRGPSYGFTGLPTLVGLAAVVPVVVSAWRVARTRERRRAKWVLIGVAAFVLVGAATAGAAAMEAKPHLQSASDKAEAGLDQLRSADTALAADTFSKAQYDFERATDQLNSPLGLLGRAVPVVAQQLTAVRDVSAAGEDLAFTASQAASSADWRQLTASNGTVDLVRVRSMQHPVAASSAALDHARATVADVRSPWLLAPLADELDTLDTKLVDAADQASIASRGLDLAPTLLGGDGPKRYLVAFATPGETRNAGGFVGAWATVVADNGTLTFERNGANMVELRNPSTDGLTLPADWAGYAGYDVPYYPGNMSASPDWVTDAQVGAAVFARSPDGEPIDGVIYADPAAMAALLKITGPVAVPGVPAPLTSDNAEQYLLVDQYIQYGKANAQRKEVLGDAARAVFDALTSRPLPGIRTLTDVLGPTVADGHLRIATLDDPETLAFFDDVGLSGRWAPRPGADLVSVRSSNAAQNKIDNWLQRSVAVDAVYDDATGAVRSHVTVVLRNDAPIFPMPPYLLGNSFGLPEATNRTDLTLFTPLLMDGVTVDGQASSAASRRELGVRAYSLRVDIARGEAVTIQFDLSGTIEAGGGYRLDVLPQPLVNPDQLTVSVAPAVDPSNRQVLFDGPNSRVQQLDAAPASGS